MKKLVLAATAAVAALPLAFAPSIASATTTYTPTLVKQFDTNDNSDYMPTTVLPFNDTQALVALSNGDLYRTDGTTDGTVAISQVATDAGLDDWYVNYDQWTRRIVTDGEGLAYFAGYTSEDGWNIWTYDGTDFAALSTDNFDYIRELYFLDGDVYLWGQNFDYTYDDDTLYKVDTDTGATTEILGGNYCDGAQQESRQVSVVNGLIVFANDTTNDCNWSLYSWDPANPGTPAVDLGAAVGASGAETEFASWDDRYAWNGELYFGGRTADGDFELWATDGTVGGTSLIKDIAPGSSNGSYPGSDSYFWFTEYNDELYFYAYDGTDDLLYKTDGTESGTVPAVTSVFRPNDYSEGPGVLFEDKMIVSFGDDTFGEEFYITDGTDAGTTLLKDIYEGSDGSLCWSNCVVPVVYDGHVFFVAHDDTQNAVWVSDGTTEGTVKVSNFGAETALGRANEFTFTQVGDRLLFAVTDDVAGGGTGEYALYAIDAQSTELAETGVDASGIALGGAFALAAGAVAMLRRRARA